MHSQCRVTRKRVGVTPVPATALDPVPDQTVISDDEAGGASSVCSQNSEPVREFWDDDDDNGFHHIPHSPQGNVINQRAGPNVVPEGDNAQAKEGAVVPPAPNIR
jgi:hypothetical protein